MANDVVVELRAKTKQFQKRVADVEDALDAVEASGRNTANTIDNVGKGLKRTGRTGRGANQILFSTGDAIQDVQFGFQGAANNIAFVAEEFANLSSKSGGVRGALSSIGSALTGAGGLILALQGALIVLPKIISALTDTADAASKAEKAIEQAAQAADQVADFQIDVGGLQVDPSEILPGLRNARADLQGYALQLSQVREQIQELQNIQSQRDAQQGLNPGLTGSTEAINEQIRALEEQEQQLIENVNSQKGTVQAFENARKEYDRQIDQLRRVKAALEGTASEAERVGKRVLTLAQRLKDLPDRPDIGFTPRNVVPGERRAPAAVRGASGDVTDLLTAEAQALLNTGKQAQAVFARLEETGLRTGETIANQFALAATGVQGLDDALRGVLRSLQNIASQLASKALVAGFASLVPGLGATSFLGNLGNLLGIPGRASGGPVAGGMPYIVGEKGPELFIPDSPGSIIPNGGSIRAAYATGVAGGGPIVLQGNLTVSLDELAFRLEQRKKLNNA
jgi:hypothetical protein